MAVAPDPEFGAVLLDQKPNRGNIGNCIFLMVLGVPMMLVVIAPSAPLEVRLGFLAFGLGLCTFAGIMLWRNWMRVFLQEGGVREYRQGRGRSLPYDRVDELIYSAGRIFAHGSYIHTVQKLALRSDDLPGPPLVCTLIFKEKDGRAPSETKTALTQVRDAITQFLERRLHQRIQREETIEWAPGVRISLRGLEVSSPDGDWTLIEWRALSRVQFEQDRLRLWTAGEAKPRLEVKTSQPNFYPAYALVHRLWKQHVA